MASIRTFISFDPPEDIYRDIVALQDELRECRADVKWENRNQMHVTIKFLGGVEESMLPSVIDTVEQCAKNAKQFGVSFQELGAFPNKRRPRVFWIGCVNEDGVLLKLKEDLDTTLRPLGFPVEDRAFHPHVTLGRVKERGNVRNLLSMLEKRIFEPHAARIDGIFVMKSVLKPSGAEHSALKAIRLP